MKRLHWLVLSQPRMQNCDMIVGTRTTTTTRSPNSLTQLKTKSIITTSLMKHTLCRVSARSASQINTQQNIRQTGETLATTNDLGKYEAVISTGQHNSYRWEQRGFLFPTLSSGSFLNIALSRKAACEAAPHGRACLHKPEGTVLEGFVPNPSTLPAGLFVPATSRLEGWRADSRPPSGPRPSHANTRHLVAITELQPGRHPKGRAKA